MGIRDFIFGKPSYEKLEDRANEYGRNGDVANAEKIWRKLNHHYPDKAEPYNMVGSMIAQTGDFGAALDWFRKAADIESHTTFSLNIGLALKELGELDQAREHFETSVTLDPDNIQARNNVAVITEELGDLEASLEAWRWMCDLLPGTHITAEFFSEIRRKCEDLERRIATKTAGDEGNQ